MTALTALVLWLRLRRSGRYNAELRATNGQLRQALAREQALRIAAEPPPDDFEIPLTREQRKSRFFIIKGTGLGAFITASASWARERILRRHTHRIAVTTAVGAAASFAGIAAFALLADDQTSTQPPAIEAGPSHQLDDSEVLSPLAAPSHSKSPRNTEDQGIPGGKSPLTRPGLLPELAQTSTSPPRQPSETASTQTGPATPASPSSSTPDANGPREQPEEAPATSPSETPPSPKVCSHLIELHLGELTICLIPKREP
ncbi:hypothetical protein [Streptomyces sp. NBC_01727]|uniref:hypothetical protein n=1 Tax=Streptomyces sp. NBC_01727 TaxID=2975924 RepID=UPI002E1383D5|nr:hypothetical protein OIE76_07690 [Streptomyces sp. NBC_01727]